jgi:uncharacterized membrane protein
MARVVAALSAVVMVAYPLLVYLGLTRARLPTVGFVLLALMALRLALRMSTEQRKHLKALLPLPLGLMALVFLAMIVDDHRLLLALPVAINMYLFGNFFFSLWKETPVVERFARLQVEELSRAEVAYCRTLTALWSLFLAANGGVTLVLALAAPLSWWAAYAGGLSYLVLGFLFAVEYTVRKIRFRRYGQAWHDRLWARYFPPYSASVPEVEPSTPGARAGS